MLRVGFAVFLVLHALLHLAGFAKAWGLGSLPAISASDLFSARRAQRLVGVLWAVACVAQLISAGLLLAGASHWWMVAAAALVLSQLLIIGAWSSARAGTVANALLVPPLVLAAAISTFQTRTDAVLRGLRASVPQERGSIVTVADIAPLPALVGRWLEGAGIVGRPRVRSVRLRQRGALRTSPGGAWMPAEASQEFTVDEPGFVWSVDVTMLGVLPIVGRDSYVGSAGRMEIKLGGLVSMVDARGPKIDQGTMLRYLGELVWFPSAALAPYIRWEAIDAEHAKATMTHGGTSVSAVFTFDSMARVVNIAADRYKGGGADAVLQRWEVPCRSWRRMGENILVPVEGSVVWKEPGGDFEYFRWEITDVATDPPAVGVGPVAQDLRARD